MASSPKTSNPNGSTVGERRKDQKVASKVPQPAAQTLTLAHPIPWTPSDPNINPERRSDLLQLMQSTIKFLKSSQFYSGFLSRLRSPEIQSGLAKIQFFGTPIQMVVYGIGTIGFSGSSRLQLSLALLLHRELALPSPIEVFDPILSATDCAVMEYLGCSVIPFNEKCRREATTPMLFYMPYCLVKLYDNLLASNWQPSMLNRMAVLGNSFGEYEKDCRILPGVAAKATHILRLMNHVREVVVDDNSGIRDYRALSKDDGVFRDTSWHFFELDSDLDMTRLRKRIEIDMTYWTRREQRKHSRAEAALVFAFVILSALLLSNLLMNWKWHCI